MALTLRSKWELLCAIAVDEAATSAAVEVMLRLLDHYNLRTGQCNPSYATISKKTSLNRDTVINAVKCLESAGWIRVHRTVESGHLAIKGQRLPSNSFSINWGKLNKSEIPTTPSRKSQPHVVGKSDHPIPEIQTTPVDNPDHGWSESPITGSRKSRPKYGNIETGNIETGKRTLTLSDTDQCALSVISRSNNLERSPEDDGAFEEFWRQYPRRVSKATARKAFDSVLKSKRATAEELIAGAMRYGQERSHQNARYTQHPATWLNAEGWLNESDLVVNAPQTRGVAIVFGIHHRGGLADE